MKILKTYTALTPVEVGEVPMLVQQTVILLNMALNKNRTQLSRFFRHSIPARGLEEFFVTTEEPDRKGDSGLLGPLGMINGILIAAGIRDFRIFRDVDPNHPDEYINSFGAFKIEPE